MTVETSCNLLFPEPSLSLTAESIYPGDQGVIQYSINGLTAPGSSGSYYCTYTLALTNPTSSSTFPLQPTSQAVSGITRNYSPQGSFSVNLFNYMLPQSLTALAPNPAAAVQLTFSVLKGSGGSSSAEAIPFLTKTVSFVFSGANPPNGPIIFIGSTPFIDGSSSSTSVPIVLFGTGFDASSSLTVSSPASLVSSIPGNPFNATINCSSCTPGSIINVSITSGTTASAPFNLQVVAPLTSAGGINLSPTSGISGTTALIQISSAYSGYFFGYWTNVSMTNSTSGAAIPFQVMQEGFSSITILADLSGVASGTSATIAVSNPDGTGYTLSTTFAVN